MGEYLWENWLRYNGTALYLASTITADVLVMQEIKNNAWVTVNNDFGVTSEAICQ